MSFIPTPGAVRTDLQFVQDGQQIHNVLWFKREAPWTQSEREALNTALQTWWTAHGAALTSSTLFLTQITSVNQDAFNSPSSVLVVSPGINGTRTSGVLSSGTACCATLRTDLRGRNYRGRFYLGGLDLNSRSSSIAFTTTFIAEVIAALSALKTAIDALGAIWVVVSKFTNKTARSNGLSTPITSVSVDGYIDSQRRRLGLRGV